MRASTANTRAHVVASVDPDEVVSLAQQMVRIRSYTGSSGEGDLASHVGAAAEHLGLEASLEAVDEGRVNLIVRLRGTGNGSTLMFNGHLDTNPVALGWTEDPFGGTLRDGCLYGLGISNMKAADAAFLGALAALQRSQVELRGDVLACLVVGEQQGGVGTIALLGRGHRADFFINGEPTSLAILTLHAGSFPLKITAVGRMRHISRANDAVNAVEEMTSVVTALRSVTFSGPDDPRYRGLRRLNVSSIRGGVGREYHDWRPGLIPDVCSIVVDVRYGPGQTEESVTDDIRAFLATLEAADPDLHTEVSRVDFKRHRMPPFETPSDAPIVQIVARNYREILGVEPRIGDIAPFKFYGTDAAHLAEIGNMPGVVCGPGGEFNSMPDERVEVAEMVAAAKIYAASVVDVCT